ncbi:mannonate dehydratase [Virgibacillus sp. C22-A2]|uniref:Mannonate dehydratase n=1 Tax=Virgibacillus tibetensis TaxID=3042313 RepID=A0ABU6KGV1_9BACI|nr:mannonate dehydratase [Virgibacillus sp. C22-A2]
MNITFRWYGKDNDTVSLQDIKQIPNVKGIVWALHKVPVGDVWEDKEIAKEVNYIKSFGFHAEVVESVNIHESIKIGNKDRDNYIDNYKQTIKNLADHGVKVIAYNFMPIFDWVRTSMREPLPDGSTALFFENKKIEDTNLKAMADGVLNSSELTLPGWEPEKLSRIEELLEEYKDITEDDLWNNLTYFLNEVLPVAESNGVKLAIHPDDPPWSVFDLPRIMKNEADIARLFSISNSPSNSLTFCSGALGANPNNDTVDIIKNVAEKSPFLHLRNVKISDNGDFIETSHLTSDGSIDLKGIVKQLSDKGYDGYIRPDHGRHIWNEKSRPGYGLYDRALGIMYLNGLWDAYNSEDKEEK